MFSYAFMVNAFLASGIVAVAAGIVGYFLVLRGEVFAGHALSHVGFAGATGAVLIGLSPLAGMLGFTIVAGIVMGVLGERLSTRDVAIGMVLALSLGLGLLFLHFHTAFATQATAVLFGNIFGVSRSMVWTLFGLAVGCLGALAVIARPLLFASLQPEMAEAKGISPRLLGVLFLGVVAIAVAESAQIVGVLLVFALMVGPAAAAAQLSARIKVAILLSVAIALAVAWTGLTIAYYTDWPTSFCITALAGLAYFVARAWRAWAGATRVVVAAKLGGAPD
jgi:zinc/manganese transport system permease protein